MANEDISTQILGSMKLGATAGLVGNIILYSFLLLLVVGIIYLMYYLFSFTNTLIVRDAINGRKIVKKVKWKESRDSKNNIWLITPFNRIKKPLPPSDSIEVTPKGKKWVEAWRGEDTESFLWIKDTFDYNTYKTAHPEFQPLTTQERELLVNEVYKSQAYKKRNLYDTIVQVSLIMAPIILIAVIGLTLGDITEALNEYSAPLTSALSNVADSFEASANALAGIQEVTVDVTGVPD